MTFESAGQRLGYGEEEPGFSRAGPHLPGGDPAPGAAALEDPVVGSQVWEKPSWMKRCLLLLQARGRSGAYSGAAAAPSPPRSQMCAASALGRHPGGVPALPPRAAAAWSVLNSGWKWLVIGRLNLPRPFLPPHLPSASSLPTCSAGGSGGWGEDPEQNKQTKPVAASSRPGGALCKSLSDKRRTGNTTGFRAIGSDQHLLSASPGRGAGDPEADEL